jgi:hypothetical protein
MKWDRRINEVWNLIEGKGKAIPVTGHEGA